MCHCEDGGLNLPGGLHFSGRNMEKWWWTSRYMWYSLYIALFSDKQKKIERNDPWDPWSIPPWEWNQGMRGCRSRQFWGRTWKFNSLRTGKPSFFCKSSINRPCSMAMLYYPMVFQVDWPLQAFGLLCLGTTSNLPRIVQKWGCSNLPWFSSLLGSCPKWLK